MSSTTDNSRAGTNPPSRERGPVVSELPKQYRPGDHESRIWDRWESSRAFHADPGRVLSGEAEPYCIVIPPPNVTAALHLGHALNNSLQDILARAHRMRGFETLWMPGTDHAGIATQAVVEKRVQREEKKRRTDFTREEFIAKIQAFKDEYEATITNQLKKMGCSCDWERQRFTMDPVCARAVREAFFRLFKDGLIYRGKRLVNWDPALQTAVADDECYDEEVETSFWYLRYPLVWGRDGETERRRDGVKDGAFGIRDSAFVSDPNAESRMPNAVSPVSWAELQRRGYPGADAHPGHEPAYVTVATTRPETYLGDTAVAMNPDDPRAGALKGMHVRLPLVGRVVPIVTDSYVVLPKAMARSEEEASDPKAEFATGFLKVTPAHDQNDYDLYQRHKGEIDANSAGNGLINMMSPDGRVSDKHGWADLGEVVGHKEAGQDKVGFIGLKMAEARKAVVKEFESRGLLEGTRPYRHSVKFSDRSKAVIEPYLSDQWYVKVTDPRMAAAANEALVPEQRSSPSPSGRGQGEGLSTLSLDSLSSKPLSPHKDPHPNPLPKGEGAENHLRFFPARYAKTYEQWHDNIRDWCISRQLWWGHRIPVWYRRETIKKGDSAEAGVIGALGLDHLIRGEYPGGVLRAHDEAGMEIDPRQILQVDRTADRTFDIFVCYDGRDTLDVKRLEEEGGYTQDPDVLDTWFSSALWPLSTLGWPDGERAAKDTGVADFPKLLDAFNPTSCLSTAREIITLWVSRMVMMNRYFMGEGAGRGPVPFYDVYIHAVIQDGDGRKMSKSLGNGVDPLEIIATHGADAMRFTLCHMATNTQDVRLPVKKDPSGKHTSEKFDLGRNFANKLWNAARFVMGMLGGRDGETERRRDGVTDPAFGIGHSAFVGTPDAASPNAESRMPNAASPLSLADRWMLSRLAAGVAEADRALREYEFSAYAQVCYDLLWRDFCDWYLEAIKPTVAGDTRQQGVVRAVLDAILRLLHPVMPFVTEAIFEQFAASSAGGVPGVAPGTPMHVVPSVRLDPPRKNGLLCTAGWPVVDGSLRDPEAEGEFERLRSLVTAVREVRAQHAVAPKRRPVLHVTAALEAVLKPQSAFVLAMGGLARITSEPAAGPSVAFRFEGGEPSLSDLADAVDAGAERTRLEKQAGELEKSVATLEGRLGNPGYADRAPAAMVQQTRDQLTKAKADLHAARTALAKIGGGTA